MTTLDTHDGIGVVDVVELLNPTEIEATKEGLCQHGADVKAIYNTAKYGNLDIYQWNCTYYSALGERDDDYLIARAAQLFAPGIPQVYYFGMLAGRNDLELLGRTRNGRDINRHDYSESEVELMRFRTFLLSFKGAISFPPCSDSEIRVERTIEEHRSGTLRRSKVARLPYRLHQAQGYCQRGLGARRLGSSWKFPGSRTLANPRDC